MVYLSSFLYLFPHLNIFIFIFLTDFIFLNSIRFTAKLNRKTQSSHILLPAHHPFPFNLYVSLYLKWISDRRYIPHAYSLCLLICMFRPLTFSVSIDNAGLMSIMLVSVVDLLPLFFILVFVFYSFSALSCFN